MIVFFYSPIIEKGKITKQKLKRYPEILKKEGLFQIEVNGRLYFDEPNFSVNEFLMYADKWIFNEDKSQDMNYFCVDTDENPLISFSMKMTDGTLILRGSCLNAMTRFREMSWRKQLLSLKNL